MKLIDELRNEHLDITRTLKKVSQKGVATKEGQEELFNAKTLLLDHLKKEDENLYPALTEAAKNNEKIRKTLKSFADDMDEISALALNFFDKYASGSAGLEFARDFGQLFSKLSMRIRREETILYELYNSIDHANK